MGLFTGEKVDVIKSTKEAINSTLPVLGILMGVGCLFKL